MLKGTPKQLIPLLLDLNQEKQYEVKEVRNRRSLSANGYFWVLCNEIGNVLNKSKEEVHIELLKSYGQILLVPLLPNQDPKGFFEYFEYECEREINGVEAVYFKVFKRSSEMNSKEFSILLEGTVQEAKNLDIKTYDEIKIEKLISEWGK